MVAGIYKENKTALRFEGLNISIEKSISGWKGHCGGGRGRLKGISIVHDGEGIGKIG